MFTNLRNEKSNSKIMKSAVKLIGNWTNQVENGLLNPETDNTRHYRLEGTFALNNRDFSLFFSFLFELEGLSEILLSCRTKDNKKIHRQKTCQNTKKLVNYFFCNHALLAPWIWSKNRPLVFGLKPSYHLEG